MVKRYEDLDFEIAPRSWLINLPLEWATNSATHERPVHVEENERGLFDTREETEDTDMDLQGRRWDLHSKHEKAVVRFPVGLGTRVSLEKRETNTSCSSGQWHDSNNPTPPSHRRGPTSRLAEFVAGGASLATMEQVIECCSMGCIGLMRVWLQSDAWAFFMSDRAG